jgi:hypothetical protein
MGTFPHTPRPKGGRTAGPPRSPLLNKARTHLRLDIKRAEANAKKYRASIERGWRNQQVDQETRRATMEQLATAYQFVADYLRDFLEKRFM